MGSIIVNVNKTRKNNLSLLGKGCENCKVRDKCLSPTCCYPIRYAYENCTDMTSDYLTFTQELKLETYIKKRKYGYAIITKGEKYRSGEYDPKWYIHFYEKDGSSSGHGVSYMDDSYIKEKNGKRYLYDKGFKFDYGIGDWILLENDNGIILW